MLKWLLNALTAALSIFLLGRKSIEMEVLKESNKTKDSVNEILKQQRDNRIDNVVDADRLWESTDNTP